MILLIDNYDSFVHNLARYLRELGCETDVVRNDAITIPSIHDRKPDAIVLSPGPCTPDEAGQSLEIVREFAGRIPMLGICLGHQTIGQALGGKVIRAPEPVHGRVSRMRHNEQGLFAGLPQPLTVCRYHSLILESTKLPETLTVTAQTDDGLIMGIEDCDRKLFGLQFHPEAILTECGHRMIASFLKLAGISHAEYAQPELQPDRPAARPTDPNRVVTF